VRNKWTTLGATQGQIRQSVEILCEGKSGVERAEVIDEVVALVQSIGRRPGPAPPRGILSKACCARLSDFRIPIGMLCCERWRNGAYGISQIHATRCVVSRIGSTF
jgi:hypothetical protein